MLHYFILSLFYVAPFKFALFIAGLINVALFLISLLMLHYFNVSLFYVALFEFALFITALIN